MTKSILKSIAIFATVTVLISSCSTDDTVTTSTTTYTTSDCSAKTGVEKVVCLSNNFLASLSSSQATSAVNTLNLSNAQKWYNLPEGPVSRIGIKFESLSAAQLVLAKALINEVLGTGANEGSKEFFLINGADDEIQAVNTDTKVTYGNGKFLIGFLGTPSTTGKWMFQLGGHHYGANVTFDKGAVVSATPLFVGLEPLEVTNSGVKSTPLAGERNGMAEMLASFTTAELASAKATSTFTDLLLSPGSTSNSYPATKLGVKVGTLSAATQAKVLTAMKPWIDDMDATTAATFTSLYNSELADTYVTYSGSTSGISGNSTSFLKSNSDYVRIDGPSVWIELIVQTGNTFKTQIHYHTVYRDRKKDYIGL
jgi:hypothetical protein